jgi:peroxin-1
MLSVSFDPAGPAVLLGSNTEVSIAPKVRSKSKLMKTLSDPSSKREDAVVKRQSDLATYPKVILRALPNYLWTFTPQTKPINDPDALAFVSPASFQKLTGESLLLSHSPSGSCRRLVFIRRLHPPSSPPVKGRSSDSPLVTSQLHPRIISNLGSNSIGPKDPSLLKSAPIAEIGWSNDIPDHHVALSYKDDTQDYGLVQFVFM